MAKYADTSIIASTNTDFVDHTSRYGYTRHTSACRSTSLFLRVLGSIRKRAQNSVSEIERTTPQGEAVNV